jgi:hypothetical protein
VLFVQFNRRRLAKLAAQKRAEKERQRCALLACCAYARTTWLCLLVATWRMNMTEWVGCATIVRGC